MDYDNAVNISYNPTYRTFKLDTPRTSYVIGLVDAEGFVCHLYYGRKLNEAGPSAADLSWLARTDEHPFTPGTNARDRLSFLDSYPAEFPGHGTGDFRESAIRVRTEGGHNAVFPTYRSHRIYGGKPALPGLPATFPGTSGDSHSAGADTLEIVCADEAIGLEITLMYSVFPDTDAIARSVRVVNRSKSPMHLVSLMSASFDMDNDGFDLITLHGSWARERHIQRRPIGFGESATASLRGESGHQNHPFMALAARNAGQNEGSVYGFSLVYSGNFYAGASVNQFSSVRARIGINPEDFSWKLDSGETFTAPEALLVYSAEGLGGMSRAFHDAFRNHLIRGAYKDRQRPILINNWEATYFDFDTDKLLSIARDAAKAGIEMLVMDDGWFGKRASDNMALGDWEVNESKLPGGLAHLVNEVNKLGLKFGIWFEPEMISPDSDLYRAHPDWAIAVPGRAPGLARNQLVLDFSRADVRNHIYAKLKTVLQSANIEYVKWDMNRPLSDIGSAALPADKQGELFHRYTLGVYEMQERLISDFPDLLLENCSGGGARFDPGMLYYSPQIWCSDDTDAIERLEIQEGTALVYPLSAAGAHVSVCPNHTVGRITPFETRGFVALAGTFGYELDITKLTDDEKNAITGLVALYHRFNGLIREGDYWRIASARETGNLDAWLVASKDRSCALLTTVHLLCRPNARSTLLKLRGLDEVKNYRITAEGEAAAADRAFLEGRLFSGGVLMNAGFPVRTPWGDFRAKLFYLEAAE